LAVTYSVIEQGQGGVRRGADIYNEKREMVKRVNPIVVWLMAQRSLKNGIDAKMTREQDYRAEADHLSNCRRQIKRPSSPCTASWRTARVKVAGAASPSSGLTLWHPMVD
jgi:hypothetical protein